MIAGGIRRFARRLAERVRWSRVWGGARDPYWLVEGVRPAVVAAVKEGWFPPGSPVLDIGCGLGDNSAWLAGQGFEVLGVDISSAAIDRARIRHAGQRRLSFGVVDACGDDLLGRQFPVLLDSGCLHVIPWQLRPLYVRNLLGWSRPGARYLLRTSNDLMPDAESLLLPLLEPGFELISVQEFPRTERRDDTERSLALRMIRR